MRVRFRGRKPTKEWRARSHAKGRCFTPTDHKFPEYGGRGITMCKRWAVSFEAFFADIGPCPSPTHSIERIDVNGNYEPGNCRWATRKEQQRNTRKNVRFDWRGQSRTLIEIAEIENVNYKLLHARMRKKGLSLAAAVALFRNAA